MQTLILTLHIIVCVLLVILILLQAGKEGMGVIFGGGNSSVFGSGGAGGILAKLTTLMAVIFVITSLSYTYVTSSRPSSESTILNVKIEDTAAPAKSAAPVQTPAVPAQKAVPAGGACVGPAANVCLRPWGKPCGRIFWGTAFGAPSEGDVMADQEESFGENPFAACRGFSAA